MRRSLFTALFLFTVVFALEAQAQAATIILVRHAEKTAIGSDPGLTALGEARAHDLASALADVPLSAVLSTQFRRTRLTAEPVAAAAGLETQIIEAAGRMDADSKAVADAVNALPRGSTVLIVGHSNTLGPIIAALGGPGIADLRDDEYSTMFILWRPEGGKIGLVRANYGARGSLDTEH
ncbi:MAG: histidine phosphatase family protein [Gemmatimonadota bacterium]